MFGRRRKQKQITQEQINEAKDKVSQAYFEGFLATKIQKELMNNIIEDLEKNSSLSEDEIEQIKIRLSKMNCVEKITMLYFAYINIGIGEMENALVESVKFAKFVENYDANKIPDDRLAIERMYEENVNN